MFIVKYPENDLPKAAEYRLVNLKEENINYVYDGSLSTRPNLETICIISCDDTILFLVRETTEPHEKGEFIELQTEGWFR